MLAFNNRFWFVSAGILCVALGGFAELGYAAGPLTLTDEVYDDGNGPSAGAWKGSASFSGNFGLSAIVDYAVFGPGKFGDFLTEQSIAFVDPTDQTHFVYAYQVLYDAGSLSINNNTVGLDGDETIGLVSHIPKALVAGTDVDPSNGANQGGTSVSWDYNDGSNAIFNGPPKKSTILFFSSPQVPEYDKAALLHLGAPTPQDVASPSNQLPPPGGDVPEPSAFLLLLLGGVGLLRQLRSRR